MTQPDSAESGTGRIDRGVVPGLFLVFGVFLFYWPVWHAGFIWDDNFYVTANATLRSLAGLGKIWFEPSASPQYYPLVFTSFWAEYHLWGLKPLGYHLVNVLLHALNAVLLWRVLRRLSVPGAWLAAALFALHPVMVESVAWVTERKNVLSTLFYLLAVLAFLRFRPLTAGEAAPARNWRFYPLVLACFLGALWSKTVTCSLPAALLLLIWWKAGRIERRDVLALAPLFVLGIALGLETVWLEKHHVGATGPYWALTFGQRCLLAGRALWFYAGKLVWPDPLIFIYPHWQMDVSAAWQYVFPLAALAVLPVLWLLRRRIGRGPLVAALFFAGTLAPALGFFDVFPFRYSYVADHFQYLASIGLYTLMAGAGTMLCGRMGPRSRVPGLIVAGVVLLGLGTLSWRQAGTYQNLETLWRTTLARNPDCAMAHNNLGTILAGDKKVAEAIRQFEQVIQLSSQDKQALQLRPDCASADYNLGVIVADQGDDAQAIELYRKSILLDPTVADVHNNLGSLLARHGRRAEAVREFQRAIQIRPDYAEAYYNLGLALAEDGQLDAAAGCFRKAIQFKPDYAAACHNLGNVLAAQGQLDEAVVQYRRAIALMPDLAPAHYRLGLVLESQRDYAAALAEYRNAYRLDPRDASACVRLAWLLGTAPDAAVRNGDEAVHLAQRAAQLAGEPDPQVLDVLAAAYAEAGRFPDAVGTAGQAFRLASAQSNNVLAGAIQARLQLYEARVPYHQKP